MGQLVITMAQVDKFMEMIIHLPVGGSGGARSGGREADGGGGGGAISFVVGGHFFWKKMPQSLQMVEQGYPVDRVVVQQERWFGQNRSGKYL